MTVAPASPHEIAARLTELVRQAQTDPVPLPEDGEFPLREAGLSSLDMVNFLVLIEDTFGIIFDDDLPHQTLRSIGSIAGYLVEIGV